MADVLGRQDGVISRAQVRAAGGGDADIARMVRRRDLTPHHPGVYVDHTGPLTRRQREWAAVLVCWPAALCRASALPAGPDPSDRLRDDAAVHVMVDRQHKRRPPRGVRVHRTAGFADQVEWHRSPPRQRVAEAVLDVAVDRARVSDRFETLASACRAGWTTPARLRAALDDRARLRGRRVLAGLIEALTTGADSVLEAEYERLERVHGLPRAERQAREQLPGRTVYRDARYRAQRLVVELDGRAHHDTAAARTRDAERDLDTRVADDTLTVRLTHGQVWDRGCPTMRRIATLLMRRGWDGPFVACPDCPG